MASNTISIELSKEKINQLESLYDIPPDYSIDNFLTKNQETKKAFFFLDKNDKIRFKETG